MIRTIWAESHSINLTWDHRTQLLFPWEPQRPLQMILLYSYRERLTSSPIPCRREQIFRMLWLTLPASVYDKAATQGEEIIVRLNTVILQGRNVLKILLLASIPLWKDKRLFSQCQDVESRWQDWKCCWQSPDHCFMARAMTFYHVLTKPHPSAAECPVMRGQEEDHCVSFLGLRRRGILPQHQLTRGDRSEESPFLWKLLSAGCCGEATDFPQKVFQCSQALAKLILQICSNCMFTALGMS